MTERNSVKVSVIIPTYNRASLVCETIDSVIAQTYKDLEIIVVDDGSTDDTANRLAAYAGNIRYVRQQNRGVNASRNYAVSLAKGEYIATLDDDDLWLPHKLATQIAILEDFPEVSFIFSNFSIYRNSEIIDSDGMQSWFSTPIDWNSFYTSSLSSAKYLPKKVENSAQDVRLYFGDIYRASLSHYYVLPSTAIYRRSMVPSSVQFAEHDSICGDWGFFARLSRDHLVCYLDHVTTYNRSHEDEVRLTRTKWEKQLEMRIDLIERLYIADEVFYGANKKLVDSVYRERLAALCKQYILAGNRQLANKMLSQYRLNSTDTTTEYLLLMLAANIPGTGRIIKTLRSLKH